jgi:hypothetical protein
MKLIMVFILGVFVGMGGSKVEAPKKVTSGYTVISADSVELSDGTRVRYDHKRNWRPQ